jgi:DNA-binding NtrC family response regulator
MSKKILLVADRPDAAWLAALERGLQPLGTLSTTRPEEASRSPLVADCDVIIVDALAVRNVEEVVAPLHAAAPSVPLVIVTNSPTPQLAKKFFQAGATDYIRKSLDPEAITATFSEILKRASTL